jgi:NAD(P)-dependent dehydrogenase (short-subunit alcohol dehydrogenase family)
LQGVQVAVADLDMAAAASAAGEIRDARAFPVNVSDRKSVEDCFTEIEDAFGGYEILCANAGVSSMKLVVDLTDEDWNRNFDMNTRGVFFSPIRPLCAIFRGHRSPAAKPVTWALCR